LTVFRRADNVQAGARDVTGTEQVRVSIGVPSLNYGRFLGACLESIRSQTHSNFEVGVVVATGDVQGFVGSLRRSVVDRDQIEDAVAGGGAATLR
jgi:hypothetical protein